MSVCHFIPALFQVCRYIKDKEILIYVLHMYVIFRVYRFRVCRSSSARLQCLSSPTAAWGWDKCPSRPWRPEVASLVCSTTRRLGMSVPVFGPAAHPLVRSYFQMSRGSPVHLYLGPPHRRHLRWQRLCCRRVTLCWTPHNPFPGKVMTLILSSHVQNVVFQINKNWLGIKCNISWIFVLGMMHMLYLTKCHFSVSFIPNSKNLFGLKHDIILLYFMDGYM